MTSPAIDTGLCGHCRHCRLVETGRSVFYLCTRSFAEPAYRKYPPLPVRACPGHEEGHPEKRHARDEGTADPARPV